jgi:sodium/potassium-transporting ATPase subunit alpha
VPTLIVDCVSVAIAFIPEGLPIALTASLTITANLMRKNKILCKSLKTVETLGSVSVICSDKTGTLTRVWDSLPSLLLVFCNDANMYRIKCT